jgi:DNA-binding beta-propeller fold protein YncE
MQRRDDTRLPGSLIQYMWSVIQLFDEGGFMRRKHLGGGAVPTWLGVLSAGCLLACDSASQAVKHGHSDAGNRSDAGPARDAGNGCNPFAAPACGRGHTCCLTGASASCQTLAACKSDVQLECHEPRDCRSGDVCCATFDPWFNTSEPSPDAGSDPGTTATALCKKSCDAPSVRLCRTSDDCASGTKCTIPPEGTNPPLLAIAAEALFVCSAQDAGSTGGARLPLVKVADIDLPGGATRFDYQDIDTAMGHLVVAHMLDDSVLIIDLADGSVVKELKGIQTARGVAVAADASTIFVTSLPDQLVLIDNKTLEEIGRVKTGSSPDGVGWDPVDKVVGVSDQGDGAISLIADSGKGTRKQVQLGVETGNVVFDVRRGWFWITVVADSPPDQLVAVDPVKAAIKQKIELAGCSGAHGLRIHPDGESAFIACEGNDTLARVALDSDHAVATAKTGSGPDVLSIDPGLGWLYVAAESGDVTVFDIEHPGVALIGHDMPGDAAHSVAVDPATHRVFFPLQSGAKGKPVLRIMRPSGI